MTLTADLRTDAAAPCPPTPVDTAVALLAAAERLLPGLERGRAVDAGTLRTAMTAAFSGSDAEGAWSWKLAYDAGEAAQVLFLRRFGPAMQARSASPVAFLAMLERLTALLPSQTRRSEESQARQQFSTPLPLAGVVAAAAALTPTDRVLEPSAGTGLLAVFAELAGTNLVLNELADTRAGLLERLFPGVPVARFDAAAIHDHLDAAVRPTVVLMNPPFSALAAVDGRVADAAIRHLASALARLAEGGRLVAVTGAGLAPDHPAWRDAFVRLQERGRVVFSAAIDGRVYARHGTTVDTRLTVIDCVPADDPAVFPASPGMAPDAATLLDWVRRDVPPRASVSASAAAPLPVLARAMAARPVRRAAAVPVVPVPTVCTPVSDPAVVELVYEPRDWAPEAGARLTAALYEPYALQSIVLPGARPHPTPLVQSAAMAAVAPPKPRYHPHLPAALVTGGVLSDAQLESVILAGEAHAGHLAGSWTVDETFDTVSAASDGAADAVRFRRGWFLGDGTGAGKGRQVAGILLDNWLKGRQRALWISKSDTLIEDARRDWSALGQEPLLVTPLARFRPGTPITLERGIVFSDAGGTGRSYHADLGAKNQRLRVHYLLEAGWKADAAIQGLGRSNRTNQAQPPLFRPVATDVRAEKRFLSTIARRLDTLGAITRGQRQTGGQGLFRADDNLESIYARAALRQLYGLLHAGKVEGCSLGDFEAATGLALCDRDGTLREELPPITTFLNRLLALTIGLQNTLFTVFEQLLTAKIEGAIASGTYDRGVETLVADSFTVTNRRTLYTHPATGAETQLFTLARRDRNQPLGLEEALEKGTGPQARLLVNARSGRAAVAVPAAGLMLDDGTVERRVRLLRPMERLTVTVAELAQSHWRPAEPEAFAAAWEAEVAVVPEFSTSTLHLVTGLLLPVWRHLPDTNLRVVRLQTDDGERVIGRVVAPDALAEVERNFGAGAGAVPVPSAEQAWASVLEGRAVLHLADGLRLRRVTVMGTHRIELSGFSEGMVERLKALGLMSEIIAWTLRLFVPVGERGPAVFAALLARRPLLRVVDRTGP